MEVLESKTQCARDFRAKTLGISQIQNLSRKRSRVQYRHITVCIKAPRDASFNLARGNLKCHLRSRIQGGSTSSLHKISGSVRMKRSTQNHFTRNRPLGGSIHDS